MIRRVLTRYLLLLFWMAVIFWASATPDLKAVPLAQQWGFLPDVLGLEATNVLELVLRKGAHLLTYAILAVIARHAVASGFPRLAVGREAFSALAVAVLYALSDEWHQSFVPTRDGRLTDVLIDSAGAALGLLLYARVYRRKRPQGS